MKKADSRLFFGGVPTAPDVEKLLNHFGSPEVGDKIEHEEVERVLDLSRTESRYRTVTNRWRNQLLRERNIRVVGRSGGFSVLTPKERLDYTEMQHGKGVRRLGEAVKEAAAVPAQELDEIQSRRHLNLQMTVTRSYAMAKLGQREYGKALAAPARQLPQRQIPK